MNAATTRCRACGPTDLSPVFDLGPMPLVNSLLAEGDLRKAEARYPLELVFCPRCALCQITETIPPEKLFDDYPYFSSVSDTMVEGAKELAIRLISERKLGGTPYRVVDPNGIVEISDTAQVEVYEGLASKAGDFESVRIRGHGTGSADIGDLNRVLIVQQYKSPEMD